ncbi:MAG: hypothetical protein IKA47_04775 [Oscillospiraceae bacterium]|nr:hypothetical protein [Oscillospiraceae bacterium]
MKKVNSVVWGVVLVVAGVLLALNTLDIMKINIFFDGWWTLFIIVPCGIGLFTEREKTGNIIGLLVGVALLLSCQGILSFSLLWKLLLPALIVIVGVKLVLSGIFGNKANEMLSQMKQNGKNPRVGFAAFSGCDMNYSGESFEGAEIVAVFGGVKCDLRNAIIEKDCAIQVTAAFGGVDILVPPNVNVKTNTIGLFGGTSNKTTACRDVPTIYISGLSMFGGIEIK